MGCLQRELGSPPEPEGGQGRAPGCWGLFPHGGGSHSPPRPEGVDVDEAGGVGGLVVPLHVHAAERKARALPWDSGGIGAALWEGTPDLAALPCCCPLIHWRLRGAQVRSLPAPGEGAHGSAMPRLHRPCQRHSPKIPSLASHVHHHLSSSWSGTARGCSPCPRVTLQAWL